MLLILGNLAELLIGLKVIFKLKTIVKTFLKQCEIYEPYQDEEDVTEST